jgi:dolichyldiphosphatase
MYATLIVCRRDLHTVQTMCGQLICLIFNKILKKLINQPRPLNSSLHSTSSGMPSLHSQFIFFFAVFYILQIFFLENKLLGMLWKLFYASLLVAASIIVAYSRVYLNYHTCEQVFVGGFCGTCFAIYWFVHEKSIESFLKRLFSLPYFRILGVRDFSPLKEYADAYLKTQNIDVKRGKID